MKSKLTGISVLLLLFAAAVTTARAQTVDELAAKGFAIAERDPIVAVARTAEPDIYYWKGFDVATGIFGDPALGALGNTAVGPGSLKFRDSLNAAGQRGFNASVKFHLSRNYTHKRRPGEVTSIDKKSVGAITDLENGNPEPAWAKPASDEIRCRGSALPGTFPGTSAIGFETEGSRVTSTGETINITLLISEPGPYAAGLRGEGLRPGECSWVDRPIAVTGVKDRWFLMRFETPAYAQLQQKLHGSEVDTSPTAAERFPDAQSIPAYMNDPKHYWSFFGVKQVNNFVISEEAYNRLHPPSPRRYDGAEWLHSDRA